MAFVYLMHSETEFGTDNLYNLKFILKTYLILLTHLIKTLGQKMAVTT